MSWRSFLFGWPEPRACVDVSARLKERILKRTGNRIRNLEVQSIHGTVVVSGEVDTLYIWQLALAAARGGMNNPERLAMRVHVLQPGEAEHLLVGEDD